MENPKNIDGLMDWRAAITAELANSKLLTPEEKTERLNLVANISMGIEEGAQEAAIVFIDLEASTQLKQVHKGDPDHWLGHIYEFLRLTSLLTGQAGGNVVKRMGDGVLLYFGDIQAAESFLDALGSHSEVGQYRYKAAAEFGKVFYLRFEPSLRDDPYGEVVDRCFGLLKKARQGEPLCGAGFYRMSAQQARYTKCDPVEIKGFADPQDAFLRLPGSSEAHPPH